ncbi:UDP-glucuronosyltransferase [Scaptodrosophila lebanonensis]|uniref:UDP-glucuronosyltransferase n=1 Tax=Drosophila lebanonensis TaxID=7225 RepID=A0A6J2U4Y9_DROLE|nr:UDP-glucuronosyltransferase [Scaptodrosophila lebanonensis]
MKLCWLVLQLLALLSCSALCANILAVLPSVWKSHYLFGRRLMQQLVEGPQNHSVTIISPHAAESGVDEELANIREIRIEGLMVNWLDMGMSFEAEEMRAQSVMERFTRLIYAGTTNVDLLLSDAQVRKLLTSGERFDLLVVDLFLSDALLGLAFYYGIPTVAISPTGANSWLNNMFGNPQASSLDPSNFLPFTERMTTSQRLVNTLMSMFERLTYNFFHMISQQSVYSKHFEHLVSQSSDARPLPHYRDLAKNLSLALINSHAVLHYPRAYLPNMLEVGGLHLMTPQKLHLPNHLREFVEAAPSGVIYVSLGADVRIDELPHEKIAVLLDAFSHLKEFHFLLKWESDEFFDQLPENVMINSWWPQAAILAHPQVKVFISSCGVLSTLESIVGNTPLLAIPILAEQEVLAKRLQLQGASLTLNYDALSYDAIVQGIRQLTLNDSYVQRLKELHRRLRTGTGDLDTLSRALQQIELVLQSNGADYLKSHANTLNFWRAEGLDVIAIIALGVFGILTVPFVAVWCILRRSYYSEAAQEQNQQLPYRTTLKAVGRMQSFGDQACAANEEPLRRTRSAQSLSARSSCSSYSSSTPTTPSSTSTTPLDLTPPPPSGSATTPLVVEHMPPLHLYVSNQPDFTTQASHNENTKRQFL